jgi:acylphosphatase
VFFRDACRREASAAGVRGWVTNRPDGRVEAWFEGPAASVERMVAWCREGPRHARVENVEVTQEDPAGHSSFGIT